MNGGEPSHAPRMRFLDGKVLVRDALGISTGGSRLPETDVPIEINTGWADDPAMRNNRGLSMPLAPGMLARLYGSREEYVQLVAASAAAAHSAGFIRPCRVQQYAEQAKTAKITEV